MLCLAGLPSSPARQLLLTPQPWVDASPARAPRALSCQQPTCRDVTEGRDGRGGPWHSVTERPTTDRTVQSHGQQRWRKTRGGRWGGEYVYLCFKYNGLRPGLHNELFCNGWVSHQHEGFLAFNSGSSANRPSVPCAMVPGEDRNRAPLCPGTRRGAGGRPGLEGGLQGM